MSYPAGASFMTMSVTCDVRQVGHFHSTPSPWGLVNRLTKTIGFLHILQLGGSFFIGRFSVVDYRFCFLGFTAHAGPDCDSRLCAGTLFHDAATTWAFLAGRHGHRRFAFFGARPWPYSGISRLLFGVLNRAPTRFIIFLWH